MSEQLKIVSLKSQKLLLIATLLCFLAVSLGCGKKKITTIEEFEAAERLFGKVGSGNFQEVGSEEILQQLKFVVTDSEGGPVSQQEVA